MIIPVRCFTCGKPIAHLYDAFVEKTRRGEDPKKVFEELGLERYCCRRMLMTHVDLIDEVLKFEV